MLLVQAKILIYDRSNLTPIAVSSMYFLLWNYVWNQDNSESNY